MKKSIIVIAGISILFLAYSCGYRSGSYWHRSDQGELLEYAIEGTGNHSLESYSKLANSIGINLDICSKDGCTPEQVANIITGINILKDPKLKSELEAKTRR